MSTNQLIKDAEYHLRVPSSLRTVLEAQAEREGKKVLDLVRERLE